jgi:DNA-binding MarR family transcriptional regulator
MRKNGISGIGPPLTASKIGPASGPWSWRRNSSRPFGLFAVRGSSRTVTSYGPAHAWPGDSVGYLVWRAHLVFRRAFDDGLAELDVTMAQVGLAGELMARGPRTVADLARVIGITPQGAALAIGHLRDLGWVTESQAKGRGRSILLEITDKGRDGYLKAAGVVEQVDKAMTSGLTHAERDAALVALKVVTDTAGPR